MKNKSNTIADLSENIRKSLSGFYPEGEVEQFVFLILNHLLNYSKIDIHLKAHVPVSDEIFQQACLITSQLKDFQPIQYIIGETEFYGLRMFLNQNVFIPRQETEELVQWIINENGYSHLKILDIGTGSGCIAVTLARFIEDSRVDALDISVQALEVAEKNAFMNGVKVNFMQYDILGDEDFPHDIRYDIIVSNPPYVRISEKHMAGRNVAGFEPHAAIFVDDEDPLIYYEAIADFGRRCLMKGGHIYFEINEALGKEVMALLHDYHYSEILLRKDINNKDRMIKAKPV
ncbi:MAG: peptide chain release factor N(5)-glutamine methyltransferase [Bacteroidales bacterium]|nr:peptide chain release factor N(5)-glutamine methyltransferase [Bacteroidales bacterium]